MAVQGRSRPLSLCTGALALVNHGVAPGTNCDKPFDAYNMVLHSPTHVHTLLAMHPSLATLQTTYQHLNAATAASELGRGSKGCRLHFHKKIF